MKKAKSRSQASVVSSKSEIKIAEEIYVPPLDVLNIHIHNLEVTDEEPKYYTIKGTFFDQLLINGIIKSVGSKQNFVYKAIAKGTMNYDPSDYEKMCLMADYPLILNIQPLRNKESNLPESSTDLHQCTSSIQHIHDISCCNIDILPLFIDQDKMIVKKRMEPMRKPPLLQRQSWDNLPLLTVKLSVTRNNLNMDHHKLLKMANYMKLTLVAAFNMQIPSEGDYNFTAASRTPLHNEMNTGLVTYNEGRRVPHRFDLMSFYPKWESLRLSDNIFTKGDCKFVCGVKSIVNPDNLDLNYYVSKGRDEGTIVWGSFHRSLILARQEHWLSKQLRKYSWPFEVHMYGENGGLSFMAFLNLFQLLYPGERTVRIAVPLQWINAETMAEKCNCELLLTPNLPSTCFNTPKPKITDSAVTSISTETNVALRPTGLDGNSAFIILEVQMARPLKEAVIPPIISSSTINAMLHEMEHECHKRECTGRGQSSRDWRATVRAAENSLRKVPHYGMTEFCIFNRQLSETRIRVELLTSFWLDASIFVNNNFVIQEFLQSDEVYEEMLMISHACLMRIASNTLLEVDSRPELDPTLRAARHARQMQDIPHAVDMYLQVIVQNPRGANSWRELSTCLRDVDADWANICINKSIVLDPRHPLTLLSKACTLYEEDPESAEPFFTALMMEYPFWTTGWVIANAYYTKRELFYMADEIMRLVKKNESEGLIEDLTLARAWGHELGDWWDSAPLLPGMNPYYIATDLLLRLRALSLAEVCLSRAISEAGETSASVHLVALCYRLRGNIDEALCNLQQGINNFGEINYLRSLQAECYHKQKNVAAAMSSFEKAGYCLSAYSILLSMPSWEPQRARCILLDLIRRQPSAYAWVALAEDLMQRAAICEGGDADVTGEQTTAKVHAIACTVQALKWDRQVGRAWAFLSQLVAPSARRHYYRCMAETCGYTFSDNLKEASRESQQSLCYRLGRPIRECCCIMCEHLKL